MSAMSNGWCVTANLEKGHRSRTLPWLRSALEQGPALVFAQEFHQRQSVESMAAEHGYRVVWPARVEPRWWMVSWIMVRADLNVEPLAPAELDLLVPFSSYVVGARISGPPLHGVTVLSVHASPTVVTAEDLARWPRELPKAREGGHGVRNAGRLHYAIWSSLRSASSARTVRCLRPGTSTRLGNGTHGTQVTPGVRSSSPRWSTRALWTSRGGCGVRSGAPGSTRETPATSSTGCSRRRTSRL